MVDESMPSPAHLRWPDSAGRMMPPAHDRAKAFEDLTARIDAALASIRAEALRAAAKFPPFNSPHEGYAVLREEVDELWDDVKANRRAEARVEAMQVGAMAVRFIADLYARDGVIPREGAV